MGSLNKKFFINNLIIFAYGLVLKYGCKVEGKNYCLFMEFLGVTINKSYRNKVNTFEY